MPTYRYRCKECGHEFEARQRMSDDPLSKCPVCGGPVRRVVGSVGIVFKGSGFYVTDHRSTNGKGRVQPVEKASGDADDKKKEESKSDKPEKPAKSSQDE